jgi:hypothetical protein
MVSSFYRFSKFSPLYFTTFLIVPHISTFSEPFIYQQIPIRRTNILSIRIVIQGGLDILMNCQRPVPIGSYILLPPYEHPFSVVGMLSGRMTVTYINHSIHIIPNNLPFVHLTNPNLAMSSYFKIEQSLSTRQELLTLKPLDFFDYPETAISTFLESQLGDHFLTDPDQKVDHIEFDHPTVSKMAEEMITDINVRRALCQTF